MSIDDFFQVSPLVVLIAHMSTLNRLDVRVCPGSTLHHNNVFLQRPGRVYRYDFHSSSGYERVPYHADASAAGLEPEKHLWAGRHGEWTESSLAAQPRETSGGTWGVTLTPPGLDAGTVAGRAYINTMRSQQAR